MRETIRAARAAKRPTATSTYWAGTVTEVIDDTHCRVAAGGNEMVCVVPASLLVEVDTAVQIRVRGNDYLVDSVLDGENQPRQIVEQIQQVQQVIEQQPAAPLSLNVAIALRLKGRFWVADVTLSWDPVVIDTLGEPLDVARYEILGQPQGAVLSEFVSLGFTPDTSGTWTAEFEAGSAWTVTVLAYGKTSSKPGVQAEPVSFTCPVDVTPPPVPSEPSVASRLGSVVTVEWDGLDTTGAAMPADLDHVTVLVDVVDPPQKTVASLAAAGAATVPADPGTTVWVSLVATDTAGNTSAPTDPVPVVLTKLVATDLGVVLPGDVAFSDVNNLIPDGAFANDLLRAERLAAATGSWSWVEQVDGSWSAHCTSENDTMPLTDGALAQAAPFRASGKLYLSMRATSTGSPGLLQILVTHGDDPTTAPVYLLPAAGAQFVEGVVDLGSTPGAVSLALNLDSASMGSAWDVHSVTARQVVPSTLIEDAAITSAKIATAAVQDANVASLNVGKLTGGVLSAEMQWAGRAIMGDPAGARVEQDSSGLRIFDASGTEQTTLTPDGSIFRGDADMADASIDALSVQTLNLEANGSTVLHAGLTPPSVPPTAASVILSTVTLAGPSGALASLLGVTRDGSEWISAVASSDGAQVSVYRHNADGTYKSTVGVIAIPQGGDYGMPSGYAVAGGVGILNGIAWVWVNTSIQDASGAHFYLNLYGTDGTKTVIYEGGHYEGRSVIVGQGKGIGAGTATQLAVSWVDDTGVVKTELVQPATGARASTITGAQGPVAYGNFDFGALRYLVAVATAVSSYTAAGAVQAAEAFTLAAGAVGIGYSAAAATYGEVTTPAGMWSATAAGVVSFYTGPNWVGAPSATFSVCSTFYDSANGYESAPSTSRSVSLKKRWPYQVTTVALASVADSGRIYLGSATMYLQTNTAGGTSSATQSTTFAAIADTGTASTDPKTAFPQAQDHEIVNDSGTLAIKADGSAKVTDLEASSAALGDPSGDHIAFDPDAPLVVQVSAVELNTDGAVTFGVAGALSAEAYEAVDLKVMRDYLVGEVLANGVNTYIDHHAAAGTRTLAVAADGSAWLGSNTEGGSMVSRVVADQSGNLYLFGTPRMTPVSTTSSANAYFGASSSGYRVLAVSSSLRRHKLCIDDAAVDADQARQLQPRMWFDKWQVADAGLDWETATVEDCLAAGLRWIPGFVAEEVEAVNPLLCTYDEDGELAGVAYDRLAVALCARAEEAEHRLAQIEARLTALEEA